MENSKKSVKDILKDKTGESLLKNPGAASVISKYASKNERSLNVNVLIADVLKDVNLMGTSNSSNRIKIFLN